MSTDRTAELNTRFGSGETLRFEPGNGGLTRAVVDHPDVRGEVYLHGAHVTAWQPRGAEPVLFVSRASQFEAGKPIRGGVPICFPWFGPKADDPSAPAHGTARLKEWEVVAADVGSGGVSIVLATTIEPFRVVHQIGFANDLTMSLQVANRSASAARFEEALHTYFAVADVRNATVSGLEGVEFLDKVDGGARKRQPDEPITFTGETDRVYLGTTATCVIEDRAMKRHISVAKSGSRATVVWNPWIAKAARMPDFGDAEWPGMVCVETCNVGEHAVVLPAGGVHEMTAVLRVASA